MADEDTAMRPRTKEEREAYIEGYIDALNEVRKKGYEQAQSWGVQMISLETSLRARDN